jgi:hypothetical protein
MGSEVRGEPDEIHGSDGGGSRCRQGCETQDHATYGECLKAARLGVAAGETAKGQY